MRTTLAVAVAMALTGCGGKSMFQTRHEAYLDQCRAMGFKPDTDNERLCALQLETQFQVRVFGN